MSSQATESAQPATPPAGGPPAADGVQETAAEAAAASAETETEGTADAGAATIALDPEPTPDPAAPPAAPPVGKPPFSVLAIAAAVCGALALIPVAVALAIAALIGIGRTGRRGRGMALAAFSLSAAWLIVGGAVGAVGLLTHGFHKPVTVRYTEAAVFKLRAGECIDSPNAQVVSVLPCSTPHAAEVFAAFTLPTSAWPGATAVARQASAGCANLLDGYLNPQLAISLSQFYVYPDQVAWTAGTRTVICEVRASSGELTQSVRGAS